MPLPSIDYLNARRELKHSRSGGKTQDWSSEQAPDQELDQFEQALGKARSAISDFALWAEASRCQYLSVINIGHQTLTAWQTCDIDETF